MQKKYTKVLETVYFHFENSFIVKALHVKMKNFICSKVEYFVENFFFINFIYGDNKIRVQKRIYFCISEAKRELSEHDYGIIKVRLALASNDSIFFLR